MDLRLVGPVINQNMVLIEEVTEELVPGVNEREMFVKRFIFRDQGCVFVYESSVPDSIDKEKTGGDSGRDDSDRYTLVFQITCFKVVG